MDFISECDEYLEQISTQLTYVPLTAASQPVSIKVSDCDAANVHLIVGGQEAKLGEFPHMVIHTLSFIIELSYPFSGKRSLDRFIYVHWMASIQAAPRKFIYFAPTDAHVIKYGFVSIFCGHSGWAINQPFGSFLWLYNSMDLVYME